MEKNTARKNEKNLFRSQSEYSYVAENFGGADFASPDGKCADHRFPYLVNMYRDRDKKNGAAIETIPGFRALSKTMSASSGQIYGLFSHTFLVAGEEKRYLLVHKGRHLYAFPEEDKDNYAILSPVCQLAACRSCGFSYGGRFYILDGDNITCLSSPTSAVTLGEETYTDAMEEAGTFPAAGGYIPTAFVDGAVYEDRNLLTNYYDVKRTLKEEDRPEGGHGLMLRPTLLDGERVLEVYGIEAGRRHLVVPEKAEYEGEILPIAVIAAGAFAGSDITEAILAPSVKVVKGVQGMNFGAFYGCSSLRRAVLYGVASISYDTFAFCTSLESVVFGKEKCEIDASAFYGCSTLKNVYCADEDASGLAYPFGSAVTVHPKTVTAWMEKGDVLRVPCHIDAISDIYTLLGGEYESLSSFQKYDGVEDVASGLTEGYAASAKASAILSAYYLKGVSAAADSRYVFATVVEKDGLPAFSDDVSTFVITLPDLCRRIVSVTLDGKALSSSSRSGGAYYKMVTKVFDGVAYGTAIRLTLPFGSHGGKTVVVRCFGADGKYSPRKDPDLKTENPLYTGTTVSAIRRCRHAALYDGKIFLSGNPALPDTVFYSVLPRSGEDALGYFGATSFFCVRDGGGAVTAMLAHPSYLALFKDGGAEGRVNYCKAAGNSETGNTRYGVVGGSGAPSAMGATLLFGDDPVFVADGGLYGVSSGTVYEEGRLEKRSCLLDGAFPSRDEMQNAVLAEWKGYLALLVSGEIFLADSAATFQHDGVMQYEWYRLTDIGKYVGQSRVYHHLSASPFSEDLPLSSLTVNGEPLFLMGDEREVTGTVAEATVLLDGVSTGKTVYYTVTTDDEGRTRHYLVDSDGEMRGGTFSPATALLSSRGILYFGTADGSLFCFNTDKRGISPMVSGKYLPVLEDEIHNFWYTFNGRAYPSGFATSFADMGAPHIAKTTTRRSLVLRIKAMENSSFTVFVRTDKGGFQKLCRVIATDCFDTSFAKRSHVAEAGQTVTLYEHERRWVEKQYLLLSEEFRSPFAIDAIAYRYTVSGRVRL